MMAEAEGSDFQRMTHGLRNSIERWFGLVEARTKCFQAPFPHMFSFDWARSWTLAFTSFHNPWYGIELRQNVLG